MKKITETNLKCRGTFQGNLRETDTTVPLKSQKGITLIALVITIIVLLILAGVTLNLVFNGGIINKSQTAVDKYTEEQAKEKLSLALFEYKMDKVTKKEGVDLQTTLSKLGPVIEAEEDTNYYEVEIDGYLFWVHKDTLEIISKGPSNPVPPTKIEFTETTAEAYIGEGKTFSLKLEPQNANPKFLKWSVSDESVATIQNGVLTGLKEGTVIVTVRSTEDASITASCTVEIKAVELTGISLNKTQVELEVDKSEILIVTYTPENATYKDIIWSTSDETIATVENGTVRGIKAGTATITATSTKNSNFTATCLVTVEQVLSIKNITDLYKFAQSINAGTSYSGYTVKLEQNITVNEGITYSFEKDTGLIKVSNNLSEFYIGTGYKGDNSGNNSVFDSNASVKGSYYASDGNTTRATIVEGTIDFGDNIICDTITINGVTVKKWPQITSNFSGKFDGKHNKISNLFIISNGLFSSCGLGVSNLKLENNLVVYDSQYVGVLGESTSKQINNVHSINNIICGGDYTGGIVGNANATINNCSNSSIVIGKNNTGGIVGNLFQKNVVENCFNKGEIFGKEYIGGIVGSSRLGENEIRYCYNLGNITAEKGIAGIISQGRDTDKVLYCYNTGSLNGNYVIGGIVGDNVTSKKCYNSGDINLKNNYAGGITARYGGVEECYNTGKVTGSSSIGGIIGEVGAQDNVPKNCKWLYNKNGSVSYGIGYRSTYSGKPSDVGCIKYTEESNSWTFNILDVVNSNSTNESEQHFTTTTERDENHPILKWELTVNN